MWGGAMRCQNFVEAPRWQNVSGEMTMIGIDYHLAVMRHSHP
jgi:hypothetical protein